MAMAARNGKLQYKINHKTEEASQKTSGKKVKCYKCVVLGHNANACPARKAEYSKKKSKPVVHNADDSFAANDSIAVGEMYMSESSRTSVLESRCTSHIVM